MKVRGQQTQRQRLGDTPSSNAKFLTSEQIDRLPTYGPDCPMCSAVTVQRDSQFGSFWGCRNYPRCKGKVRIPHA